MSKKQPADYLRDILRELEDIATFTNDSRINPTLAHNLCGGGCADKAHDVASVPFGRALSRTAIMTLTPRARCEKSEPWVSKRDLGRTGNASALAAQGDRLCNTK